MLTSVPGGADVIEHHQPDSSSAVGFARFLSRCRERFRAPPRTPPPRADVAPGHDAETADQPGAQIRHDVAVEVREQQHVEFLRRITSCMHAASTMRSS
jgi:hypothetical protein